MSCTSKLGDTKPPLHASEKTIIKTIENKTIYIFEFF